VSEVGKHETQTTNADGLHPRLQMKQWLTPRLLSLLALQKSDRLPVKWNPRLAINANQVVGGFAGTTLIAEALDRRVWLDLDVVGKSSSVVVDEKYFHRLALLGLSLF